MKLLTALGCCLLFVHLHSEIASAQEHKNGTLTVSPAYVEVTLAEPSEEQTISLRYTNNSSSPVSLQMFPLNFNHTDANGTIGFLSQDTGSYSYALASYLSLSASEIQIDPKQSVVFDVLVRNSPALTPGGHYGAVIAKVITNPDDSEGAIIAPSLSTLIFLRKTGGERYNLSLKQTVPASGVMFNYPDQMQLEFQNEGNVHMVPYGTVEITDMFGRMIKRGILNTSSFMVMPESRRNISVSLEQVTWSFPISFNMITVSGNDSLKKTTFLHKDSTLYISPWFFGLIIAIGVFGIYRKRRKKVHDTKSVQNDMIIKEIKYKRRRRKVR